MLRTKRPSFAAVFAAYQYEVGRYAEARDQLTLVVTGSTSSGQFISVVRREQSLIAPTPVLKLSKSICPVTDETRFQSTNRQYFIPLAIG